MSRGSILALTRSKSATCKAQGAKRKRKTLNFTLQLCALRFTLFASEGVFMIIDLHTHSLLSDGELLPSELVRRAQVNGYKAIAITDHVDFSNIDFVLPRLVKIAKHLNALWDITVLPGVELTHVPLEDFKKLTLFARKHGAKIVVGHGQSPSEPVLAGTNIAAIEAGVDILAHPGVITEEAGKTAVKNAVTLEITARKSPGDPNSHVVKGARATGARLVLDSDAHAPEDLLTVEKIKAILNPLGVESKAVFSSAVRLSNVKE